jgi:hypothetical protein
MVDPTVAHEYVKGTITTRLGWLTFVHQGRRITRYPYAVTKPQAESSRCPAINPRMKNS